jgi:hypothetical protein
MRRLIFLVILALASGAWAQSKPVPNRPAPKMEPLPEAPPPPPIPGPDEPSVRIPVQESDKVEEIRDGGRVVALKVTPVGGRPYYLYDTTGTGNWMRRDSLDDGVRVPMWPIKQWE